MPIKNKSMLRGHPWRMPHLTEIGSERYSFRLSWAVKSVRKIRIQFRRVTGIPNLEAVERIFCKILYRGLCKSRFGE